MVFLIWIYGNCGFMDSKILKTIELIKGKEINLFRRHPWVFSGALKSIPDEIEDGELAYVEDYKRQRLGFGHFHNGSIAIKMLNFGSSEYSNEFWIYRLKNALEFRNELHIDNLKTNCYRWIHGEGDHLPGLIIDVYDHVVVIQCHTIGMHKMIGQVTEAIKNILGDKLKCIIDKSKESLPAEYSEGVQTGVLFGDYEEVLCLENGFHFTIDCISGQKTGFFLDQRDNRKLLAQYSKNKTVLNAFSYSGGFSIYALGNGAAHVSSVDSSKKAIELLNQNILHNYFTDKSHNSICTDVNDYLKNMISDHYDLIILDPPAFAKSVSKRHAAVQAYKRINLLAMKKIKSKGLLFTFSCSQVVDEQLFYNTIVSAGIESGRVVRVLHKLSQGPDHPISLFHPEGSYLKGLVLSIDNE